MRNIAFTGLAKGGDSDRLMRRPVRFDTGMYGNIQSEIKNIMNTPINEMFSNDVSNNISNDIINDEINQLSNEKKILNRETSN